MLFQSWDSGKNWEEKHFDKNIVFAGDPWLAMNKRGTLILTMLVKLSGLKTIDLIVFVSKDSGKSWEDNPLNLGSLHDKQNVSIDPMYQNFLIVSSKPNKNNDNNKNLDGIMVTRLYSNGSFREVNWHGVSNINKNVSTSIMTSTGELIVPYVDYSLNRKMLNTRRNWIVKSKDLGRSFSEPILISEGGRYPELY